VNKRPGFWIGPFALFGILGVGLAQGTAATRPVAASKTATPARTRAAATHRAAHVTAAPATSRAPRHPLYSVDRSLTRKAKLAHARAVATAREMAYTVVPRYKIDASGELVPDVHAAAAIIYNPETNQVLWEENSQTQRAIASITKVMTATVFLENNPDLSQPVAIEHGDVFQASTTHLRVNDRVTADDLLHLLLIASDNAAARALARVSPYGSDGFVRRMNVKASDLGLRSTSYADPSGLLAENVSSAYDMARLITYASADERIASTMRISEYTVYTPKRAIMFRSTNHLLGRDDVDVRAAKTGFIAKAGYCLATLLRLPQNGHQVAVVVLGARSNAGRFMETQNLFTWLTAKAATLFAPKPQVQ
jgi:D-alanyl-D-alanine endopeptidase (penicillin-binding protein 7)